MKIWGWKWLAFAVLAWSLTAIPVAAQGRGGLGMGMMRGGGAGGGVLMLALAEPVQKELGLSPEAIEKVQKVSASAREELQGAMAGFAQGGFQNLSDEQRQEMMTKMQDTNRKMQEKYLPKMQEALTPEQFQRLKQIGWQMAGAGAINDPEVVKELKITPEQTAAAKKVGDDFTAKQRSMMQEAFQGGGPNPELMAKMQDLMKQRDTKTLEVLSTEQREALTKLQGKPFDVTQLQGRGGPGGRGGAGGGGRGGAGGAGGRGGAPGAPGAPGKAN